MAFVRSVIAVTFNALWRFPGGSMYFRLIDLGVGLGVGRDERFSVMLFYRFNFFNMYDNIRYMGYRPSPNKININLFI